MDRIISVLVVLIFVYFSLNVNGQYSYPRPRRQCRAPNSRTNGICVNFSQCQNAQWNYYNYRVKPAVCVNDPIDPIVCCYTGSSLSQKSSPLTQNGGGIQSGGRKTKLVIAQPKKSQRNGGSQRACQKLTAPVGPGAGVGGVPADPDEFPFMAAIGWKNPFGSGYMYGCGGSLITSNFVLTAAHCASVAGNTPDVVRTGGVSLQGVSPYEYPIEVIYVHHGYRPRQAYNDIAIIKLERPSEHEPACLWSYGAIEQRQVHGIGYGNTKLVGTGSKILMKVKLTIISNQQCSGYYTPRPKLRSGIVDSQVCAWDPNQLMDTRQGDSGGPIVLREQPKNGIEAFFVVGITSYGDGCASGPPSIYTRVSSYIDWIESIVWPLG